MNVSAAKKLSVPVQTCHALLYGSSSLLTLWVGSGGEGTLLWSRAIILAVGLWAIYLLGAKFLKEDPKQILSAAKGPALRVGLAYGVLTALPLLVLIFALKYGDVTALAAYKSALLSFPRPSLLAIVALVAAAPAQELIWRGQLQPHWGVGSTAFLQAINIAFGVQHFVPFLATWGAAALFGRLAQKRGVATAAVAASAWSALSLIALLL